MEPPRDSTQRNTTITRGRRGKTPQKMQFGDLLASYRNDYQTACTETIFEHFEWFVKLVFLHSLFHACLVGDFRSACKWGVLPHPRGKKPLALGRRPHLFGARVFARKYALFTFKTVFRVQTDPLSARKQNNEFKLTQSRFLKHLKR